jgi:hypothetical protein
VKEEILKSFLILFSKETESNNNIDEINAIKEKEKEIAKKIKILKKNMISGLENDNIKDVEMEIYFGENYSKMENNYYFGKQLSHLKLQESEDVFEEERIFIPVYSEIKKYIRKFVFQGMQETLLLK